MIWEAQYWHILARLHHDLVSLQADVSSSRARSDSETERNSGRIQPADKMTKERSSRSVLGIFGMSKEKIDRTSREKSNNGNKSPSSTSTITENKERDDKRKEEKHKESRTIDIKQERDSDTGDDNFLVYSALFHL